MTAKEWSLDQITLEPQDTAGPYGYGPMERGMWFQLNIYSSNSSGAPAPVKVTVSFAQRLSTGPVSLPISGYPQTGSSFNQTVNISRTGTYFIDINNINSFSVTLEGNILVQETETNYRIIYPYTIPGFLIMLGGAIALVFGIFKKPKKPLKSRSIHKKMIKIRMVQLD